MKNKHQLQTLEVVKCLNIAVVKNGCIDQKNQQGMALVVVLMVLLLVTVIGTVAVRQSNIDLRLVTAAQVNEVLFQANDAAFRKIEKEDRVLESANNTGGQGTSLKAYMSDPLKEGYEINFCVRSKGNRLFDEAKISKLNQKGDLINSFSNGYCDPNNVDEYVSEGRVITQMTFVRALPSSYLNNDDDANEDVTNDDVFLDQVEGTSSNDLVQGQGGINVSLNEPKSSGCNNFVGYATSVVPALSNTSLNDIADCLRLPRTIPGKKTVEECLKENNVPFKTHIQAYRSQSAGLNCIESK